MADHTEQPRGRPSPERRARPWHGPTCRLILLTASLLAATAAMHLGGIDSPAAHEGAFRVPWWALAPVFAIGELCAVHVQLRRSAHTLTLSELPLVVGLLLATPGELLVAQLVGAGSVLAWSMRRMPIRLAFNLAQFLLVTSVAAEIIGLLDTGGGLASPVTWLVCTLAVLVAGALAVVLIAVAIALVEGVFDLRRLGGMLAAAAVVSATNSALALAGVVVADRDPLAFLLLVVPSVTVVLAYRAYLSARAQHARLEFLHAATKGLAHAPDTERGLSDVLDRAVATLRAGWAEVALLPTQDGDAPLALRRGGDRDTSLQPLDARVADAARAVVAGGTRPNAFDVRGDTGPLGRHLQQANAKSALVAPLVGESRLMGTVMLVDRTGAATPYTEEELRLFETLARQVGRWLDQDRLEQTVWRLRELQEQLEHQAFHDPLTGLANRSRFSARVEEALHEDPDAIAVLFLDLDGFKSVNDTLGHTTGDELLVVVARRLRSILPRTGLAARLGGDEFAMLLTGHDVSDVQLIAGRIVSALSTPIRLGGQDLQVHGSVGVAVRDGADDAEDLLRKADVAMYAAKGRGRGQVATYDPALHDAVVRRHELAGDLERAIANEEFAVHFQPITDIASGSVVGAEALVRWESPTRGMVPPGEFIECAEESGLIVQIGRLVLDEACRQLPELESALDAPGLALHVNLSALEFAQPDLVDRVADVLKRRRIPAGQLVLEVTETAMMRTGGGTATLERLHELGVRLALDDFGTGWSSLGSLRTLPIDIVKIAKPFVDGIGRDPGAVAFIKMMLGLFSTLGLPVVAEGVEDREQLAVLRDLDCAMGQGYLFARPAPCGSLALERMVRAAA